MNTRIKLRLGVENRQTIEVTGKADHLDRAVSPS